MAFRFFFRTGDRPYEERLGRLERKFIRICRKTSDWTLRSFANSAAVSAQEMNHWLFLNEQSLFRQYLNRITGDTASRLIRTWFLLCCAGFDIDESLPEFSDADFEYFEDLMEKGGMGGGSFRKEMTGYGEILGSRELYQDLVDNIKAMLSMDLDLEQTMTFGILVAQMLEKAAERCRRVLK